MLKLYDLNLDNRLLLGTAQYPSLEILLKAIEASQTQMITVSLSKQVEGARAQTEFWTAIQATGCHILPNTAGCFSAAHAVEMACMARELYGTAFIKLEVLDDMHYLNPKGVALVDAARQLCAAGFKVLPYCSEDISIASELVRCGCQVLMPWAAPIGSAQGVTNRAGLKRLRETFPDTTLIIDAGIGSPADATTVLGLGYDGVLINTAIAQALDVTAMAHAFMYAVKAGRIGFEAGCLPPREVAHASTALTQTPFYS